MSLETLFERPLPKRTKKERQASLTLKRLERAAMRWYEAYEQFVGCDPDLVDQEIFKRRMRLIKACAAHAKARAKAKARRKR